jgi:hypothetical protein
MPGALRLATIVMLATGGLFTGGVMWYAWERVWIWRRLALAAYAVDFRRSLRKADPALPILLVICAVRVPRDGSLLRLSLARRAPRYAPLPAIRPARARS